MFFVVAQKRNFQVVYFKKLVYNNCSYFKLLILAVENDIKKDTKGELLCK